MRIGTDFSGIGSPEQALKNLKVKHSVEFACEIDKYARESYLANHHCKKMYEDITKRDHSKVRQLDIYIDGFPCQAFSMAGKRMGFDDVRGTLFFNVAEFIKINQPKVFILENVKGLLSHDKNNPKAEYGNTFNTIISLLSDNGGTVNGQTSIPFYDDGLGYHIYFKVLNTKEHGIPQNRERIFIVGFKDFTEYRFPTTEPLELKLKDLLEDNVDEKYYLSDLAISRLINNNSGFHSTIKTGDDIASCHGARDYEKLARGMNIVKVNSATKKGYEEAKEGYEEAKEGDSINYSVPNSKTRRGRVGKGVAQTLDTSCNQAVIGAIRGRSNGSKNEQTLEINESGNCNSLTSVQKDNVVVQLNSSNESGGKQPYKQNRVYDADNGISPALDTECGRPSYKSDMQIRKLTPLECFRLQGFPDDFKKVVSDTQLYKQAGNSITVNVIQKVIENICLTNKK